MAMQKPESEAEHYDGETPRALRCARAFSSEVGTGSREENASKQKAGASVPIQSERRRL
jgi:hypothetical protein